MKWTRKWFVRRARSIGRAEKTREFQTGSTVERPQETWQERQERAESALLERESERIAINKRILKVWQSLDSIKLRSVLFFWSIGGREELFLDSENLAALADLFDTTTSVYVYTRNHGPILLKLRSDAVLRVAIQPDDYVWFEGEVVLVPERQNDGD